MNRWHISLRVQAALGALLVVGMVVSVFMAGCGCRSTQAEGNAAATTTQDKPSSTEKGPAIEETTQNPEGVAVLPEAKEDLEAGAEELVAQAEQGQADKRSEAEGKGLTLLSGTVYLMDGDELCTYEEVDVDNVADDAGVYETIYAILEFDEPQQLAWIDGNGVEQSFEASHVCLGQGDATLTVWEDVQEAHVCVAGTLEAPSGAVPTVPTLKDAELLYIE